MAGLMARKALQMGHQMRCLEISMGLFFQCSVTLLIGVHSYDYEKLLLESQS